MKKMELIGKGKGRTGGKREGLGQRAKRGQVVWCEREGGHAGRRDGRNVNKRANREKQREKKEGTKISLQTHTQTYTLTDTRDRELV